MAALRRRLLRILAWSGLSAAILIVLLEAILRLLIPSGFDFQRLVEPDAYRWVRFRPRAEGYLTIAVPSPLNKKCEYRSPVRINGQGLRAEHDYAAQPGPGVTRVLCLGDSITFGWGLDEAYSYPRLLERRLAPAATARGESFEVINAGVPSYSSRQGLIWLDRELLTLSPRIVIAQFGFNDCLATWQRMAGPIRLVPDRRAMPGTVGAWSPCDFGFAGGLTNALDNTHDARIALMLYTVVQGRLVGGSLTRLEDPLHPGVKTGGFGRARVPPPDYQDNLLAMAQLCRERGVRLILMDTWGTPDEYRAAMTSAARAAGVEQISQTEIITAAIGNKDHCLEREDLKQWAETIRARYRDPAFIDRQPIYYLVLDQLHPSEIGNILLVERLAEAIIPGAGEQSPPDWHRVP